MKIAIVDYGSGNLRSVSKAIEKIAPISTQVLVTGDPEEVLKADRVVFPGQGAMPDCMKNLRTTGMEEAVRNAIRNKPFFAVCVGEQMLFEHSEEGDCRAWAFSRATSFALLPTVWIKPVHASKFLRWAGIR